MRSILLIFLSAGMLALFFAPWHMTHVVWFCLVPWLFVLSTCRTKREALGYSVLLSFLFGILASYSVVIGLHHVGHLTWPGAALLSLPFLLLHQPQFLIFSVVWVAWQRRGIDSLALIGLAFLYVALEAWIPKVFLDTLGHAFINARYMRQAVDVGGIPLLTFTAFFVNLIIWRLITIWKTQRSQILTWKVLRLPALAIILVTSINIYGAWRLDEVNSIVARSDKFARALVVQANIEGSLKSQALTAGVNFPKTLIIDRYLKQSTEGLRKYPEVDFVIWPETSFPGVFRYGGHPFGDALDRRLENFVQENNRSLIFGGQGYDKVEKKAYNLVTLLSPDLKHQEYRKNILLPGGEYWPLADEFPILKKSLPPTSGFSRGPGPTKLELPTATGIALVNIVVCYESIFIDYALRGADLGGQLILNITDDSWFGMSNQAALHLSFSIFTSIATRLPQIIGTNSGISALITADGEVTGATQLMTKDTAHYVAPLTEPIPTLLKRWGDWFGKWSLLAALILFVLSYVKLNRVKTN